MNKIRVVVISGGISTEHEVSIKSGAMVFDNLDREKYEVEKAVIAKDGSWKFSFDEKDYSLDEALEVLKQQSFDIAYLALHGEFGEDGQIQKLLDGIGQKYTGSGAEASAKAMDKDIANKIFREAGLLVPEYEIVKDLDSLEKLDYLGLPLVVKPNGGGSSVGVNIPKEKSEIKEAIQNALKYDGKVMVQKFIAGRELTCGVIQKDGEEIALMPTEIVPVVSDFFNYEAKYEAGGSREITPPNLEKEKISELQSLALKAHKSLGCHGVSRTDFILSGDKFYILETNTIPGMTETSLVPQAVAAMGISCGELLDLIIEAALS